MRLLLTMTINTENRGLHVVGEAVSGDASLVIQQEMDIEAEALGVRSCVQKGDRPGLISALRDATGLETADASPD